MSPWRAGRENLSVVSCNHHSLEVVSRQTVLSARARYLIAALTASGPVRNDENTGENSMNQSDKLLRIGKRKRNIGLLFFIIFLFI